MSPTASTAHGSGSASPVRCPVTVRSKLSFPVASITFSRTDNLYLVKAILNHPELMRRMTDDKQVALTIGDLRKARPVVSYIVARVDEAVAAVFVLISTLASGEIHFAFLPEFWGREKTEKVGREFLSWLWRTSSLRKLVAPVPGHNRLCRRLALAVGFRDSGICGEPVMKHGVKYETNILVIERPQ